MKDRLRLVFLWGVFSFLASSCAEIEPTFKFREQPVKTGEMRLLNLDVSETIGEDLPYDVRITFEAMGQPQIKRVCFRWLSEKASVPSPSLYCYTWEAQTDRGIDSACTRWLAEGPYALSSPLFCANAENVQYGNPGQFNVRIRSRNVEQYYNRLEAYAEYQRGADTDITNKISTKVRVEKVEQ
ncbi:MAG: hypothetical protein GX443_02510 [Deltaproteobacteria bacterium]|nr:hypothetical protein [Deltaproteobacteria bacterium]